MFLAVHLSDLLSDSEDGHSELMPDHITSCPRKQCSSNIIIFSKLFLCIISTTMKFLFNPFSATARTFPPPFTLCSYTENCQTQYHTAHSLYLDDSPGCASVFAHSFYVSQKSAAPYKIILQKFLNTIMIYIMSRNTNCISHHH